MIGNSSLREVVRTDTLTSVAGSHHALSLVSDFFILFLHLQIVQSGTQYLECFFFVLDLGFFILACNYQSCRFVSQTDSRVRRVYALTAVSGCTVHIHANIVRIQIYFHVVHFRQHSNSRCRGMDTTAGFCFRHTLYTMGAALIFQSGVCALALDQDNSFLDASKACIVDFHQLRLPVVPLCVAGVHTQKICTKQRRFLSACTCTDLQDNVLFIVRILRQKQDLQIRFLLLDGVFQFGDLHLGQFTHFLITFVQHLLGFRQIGLGFLVFLVFFYDRLHLAHFLDVFLPHRLVVYDLRI